MSKSRFKRLCHQMTGRPRTNAEILDRKYSTKTRGERRRRQRERMFKQYPFCEYCDCDLVLIDFIDWKKNHRHQKVPGNAAVLFARHSRNVRSQRQKNNYYSLVCCKCADEWSKKDVLRIPIESRRAAANAYPVIGWVGVND